MSNKYRLPLDYEQLIIALELAHMVLKDAFIRDKFLDELDLADEPAYEIQDILEKYLNPDD